MKSAVIYRIITPSNFIYVGCTINIRDRKNDYRTLQCKQQRLIYNALKKHPFDTCDFLILEICDANERHNIETFWIKELNTHRRDNSKGLNMTYGGKGVEGLLLTGNGLKKRIGIHAGEKNGNYGRKHTEEARAIMSESAKGNTIWVGRKHSEISKLKISQAKRGIPSGTKGRKMSPEYGEAISARMRYLILNFETGIYYEGTKEAAMYNNLKQGTLKGWLGGRGTNRSSMQYV